MPRQKPYLDRPFIPSTSLFIATYKLNSKVDMLVPDTMEESYDSEFHRVDATATYSNFRRFETEVKLDIGPIE